MRVAEIDWRVPFAGFPVKSRADRTGAGMDVSVILWRCPAKNRGKIDAGRIRAAEKLPMGLPVSDNEKTVLILKFSDFVL
jgi:hypothetical protein